MFNLNLKQLLPLSALLAVLALTQPAFGQSMTVDLNSATAAELAEALDGVGEVRAQAIVDWREQNGGFMQLDDLTQVDGIGPSILEVNRERLRLGSN